MIRKGAGVHALNDLFESSANKIRRLHFTAIVYGSEQYEFLEPLLEDHQEKVQTDFTTCQLNLVKNLIYRDISRPFES